MFPKAQRINAKKEIDLLYKKGLVFNSDYLRVFVLNNNLKINRFTVVVSKKISSKAVIRNKIKRRLKRALFLVQASFSKKVDILVLVTNQDVQNLKITELSDKFSFLSKKLNNL